MDFPVSADHRGKNRKKKENIAKYLDLARERKKIVEDEHDSDTNRSWCTWKHAKRFGEKTGGTGNQKENRDYPDYRIAKIERILEGFWRLEETCGHSKSGRRPPANAGLKNSLRAK